MREPWFQSAAKQFIKLVQRCLASHGDVIDLVQRIRVEDSTCQEVGLNHITYVAEVTTGFSVPVDLNCFPADQSRYPLGNDSRVGTLWILAGAKDIEITQTDAPHPIASGEHGGVKLVHPFRESIR
ncbi:hypothetical protein SDC9_188667 [bioreactor metagenome]|uniref:Uncharacterized protein n=1 Tax=bioreactor metagenome TaxID=1076179 RepID=A0A645HPY9_9ZZZZ